MIEPLEQRALMSTVILDSSHPQFAFHSANGDQVVISLHGPGAAQIQLADDDSPNSQDLASVMISGSRSRTTLTIQQRATAGVPMRVGLIHSDGPLGRIDLLGGNFRDGTIDVEGDLGAISIGGNGLRLGITVAGTLGKIGVAGDAQDVSLNADTQIRKLAFANDVVNCSISTPGNLRSVRVGGSVTASTILAGATLTSASDLSTGSYSAATITAVVVGGRVSDSVIAAGGDPGTDGLFDIGDVLAGGRIKSLVVDGTIDGSTSPHLHPGIYAAKIQHIKLGGVHYADATAANAAVIGSAVLDPLPANILTAIEVQQIIENAVAQARKLKINATISVTDRDGHILALVRMTDTAFDPAIQFVDITAGGTGGLEALNIISPSSPNDVVVPSSLIAATKAGTAAFLSSSGGNAFTTRTAGYIIQKNFPPGVDNQAGGPLFGVQLSNLPTSDINALPLGLSADPGGVPLYRDGVLVGGIGVEADGIYTVDPTGVGGTATTEERIALAGQSGFQPPSRILASNILVGGLRLDYANAKPPKVSALAPLVDYSTLLSDEAIVELVMPHETPVGSTGRASEFQSTRLGDIAGIVPDGSQAPGSASLDFYSETTGQFTFLDGAASQGQQLTAGDVQTILLQAHQTNHRLRAAIRAGGDQMSQVTVSVVDTEGNVLGVFATGDAPRFGYDVSVQKARTAAFFSRGDARQLLSALDSEVDITGVNIKVPHSTPESAIIPQSFSQYVADAASVGVNLDGSIALSDRALGFLARPNFPDGINGAPNGPFSVPQGDFSPFNTGLQTSLIIPKLAEVLINFRAVVLAGETPLLGEIDALQLFAGGTLSGLGSAVPLESNSRPTNTNPRGGLPGKSLANGMQIFAGSVPLYKNGILVGAIGVSGDGIDQDDTVALAGSAGYQSLGDRVVRADQFVTSNGIRLPYVKIPRRPLL